MSYTYINTGLVLIDEYAEDGSLTRHEATDFVRNVARDFGDDGIDIYNIGDYIDDVIEFGSDEGTVAFKPFGFHGEVNGIDVDEDINEAILIKLDQSDMFTNGHLDENKMVGVVGDVRIDLFRYLPRNVAGELSLHVGIVTACIDE